MRHLLPSLIALGLLVLPASAGAQDQPDEPSCSAVEADLAACRRSADETQRTCKQELESSAARAQQSVNGLTSAAAWMNQLAAYDSGEVDLLPRPRITGTLLDRAMLRVGGDGGGRTFHRRLLVEALELVAPRAWGRIRGGGATAIDAWFVSTAPIDPDIIAEAEHVHGAQPGPGGPPLTAALSLVRAFEVAAHCTAPGPDARECGRAHQLQTMLESTGSLVIRRRVQEIWATECSAVSPAGIMPWIEDFPSAQLGAAGEPWADIAESAHAKLFACYLDDTTNHLPYGSWLKDTLPPATALRAARFLRRVDAIRSNWSETSREAACARAVRAMQTFVVPPTCAVPLGDFREGLKAWSAAGAKRDDANIALGMCAEFAQLLWEGKAASIDQSFAHPPSIDEMVAAKEAPPTPMWRLRSHCDERRGDVASFPGDLAELGTFARGFGEGTDRAPFRLDPASGRPVERVRFDAVQGAGPWAEHVARGRRACDVLGLGEERCKVCAASPSQALYDCALAAELEASWSARTRKLALAVLSVLFVAVASSWLRRLLRARKAFAPWAREASAFFDSIGLSCRPESARALLPSRYDTLVVTLPPEPAWERWGKGAVVVRAPSSSRVLERDVNHAAFVARRLGVSVAILEHDDGASSEMSAIRAMLEWSGKGGSKAVQVLPIGAGRVRWSKSAQDVLALVEESSLRGNPFELRGRIATSTQFFNRERLVSGLLAASQAGHWMVITGLRRFGKSSLALEVARRLPGPSAYVDLAGFDHEIAQPGDPAAAADRILRFMCLRLVESARSFWPDATLPSPPEESSVDVAALTLWFRELSRACHDGAGRTVPLLVVIDEIEQALGGGPDRLGHALDVLAIVVGRLKSAVGDTAMPDGGSPIAVFLTSALHPLLWAPLRTLAHQSLMGSFQRVCVPSLDADAASTMMRSLGGRQGVRFTDAALDKMVAESQGVPILLRRLGASVLELYDAERARQGSLGAVEVGIEGTTEAVDREAREGSPTRVWVETEIAGPTTVVGALLRALSRTDMVSTDTLAALAKRRIEEDFVRTGIAKTLPPDELDRRADEAAHVILQLLDESGLVVPYGDLTSPSGYSLPDGAIRRVLSVQPSVRPRAAKPA